MSQEYIDFIDKFLATTEIKEWDVPNSTRGNRKYAGVYLIRHRNTGKVYVGSSGDLYSRRTGHISKLRRGLHWLQDLQIAYSESPELEWTYILTGNKDEAFDLEQMVLDHYLPRGQLFNMAANARCARLGLGHGERVREILRAKVKERVSDPAYRKMLSEANRGRTHSEETKAKIGEWQKGKVTQPETRLKMSEASKGKPKSPEHVAKIREMIRAKRSTKVSIEGVEYPSLAEAARALGIHPGVMPNRMKNKSGKYSTWKYL